MNSKKRIIKIVFLANLLALGVILNIVENYITFPIPVPNAKIGLANVVTLVIIYLYSWKEGYAIAILRVILATALSGRWALFPMSMLGMVLATTTMVMLRYSKRVSIIVVSIAGSIMHAVGQILGASLFVVHSIAPIVHLPLMLVVSIVAGIVTGVVADRVLYIIKKRISTEVTTEVVEETPTDGNS